MSKGRRPAELRTVKYVGPDTLNDHSWVVPAIPCCNRHGLRVYRVAGSLARRRHNDRGRSDVQRGTRRGGKHTRAGRLRAVGSHRRGGRYRVLVSRHIRPWGYDRVQHYCPRRCHTCCRRGGGPRGVFHGASAGGPKAALNNRPLRGVGRALRHDAGGTISIKTMQPIAIKACRPRVTTRSNPSSSSAPCSSPSWPSSPVFLASSKYHWCASTVVRLSRCRRRL